MDLFRWRGEPIQDIRTWAIERSESMVSYECTQHTPWGPEISQGEMPESFWNTLAWTGGRSYKRLA